MIIIIGYRIFLERDKELGNMVNTYEIGMFCEAFFLEFPI
jgi:hypothetical protein